MTLNLTLQILDAFEKLSPEGKCEAMTYAEKLAAEADKAKAARRKPARANKKKK